jgi:glycosyltransferase involved in cell wall biosynthesis
VTEPPARATGPGPRIAVLGAFPFPYPQGSQVFVADQIRALAAAGARPVLLSYGAGRGEGPEDIERISPPARTAPRVMRSGPSWGKPMADVALLASWQRAARRARSRGQRFDVVLAHNAEAAAIALLSRRATGTPVVYVAHTLLRHELSAYLPKRYAREAGRLGRQIDRSLTRRVDGVIVLSDEARQALSPHARGEVARIPPGFTPRPAPETALQANICARHDLVPGGYALYSGNLDRYQELDLLEAASGLLPASAPRLVVATHDDGCDADATAARETGRARVRRVAVGDFEEMRALLHGAYCLVACRRRVGGFPIKLLNYMETGRPILAFDGLAPGLRHGESAWLVDEARGAGGLADGLVQLAADPALARRLGEGARRRLETHHPWPAVASTTLEYLARLHAGRRSARSPSRAEPAC